MMLGGWCPLGSEMWLRRWVDGQGLRHRAARIWLLDCDGLRHWLWSAWCPEGRLLGSGTADQRTAARSAADNALSSRCPPAA